MKDDELWMKKMKEKLEDYSEPTPVAGWEQLEKELMLSVTRRNISYWKWTAAVAAVFLLVAMTSVSLYFLGTPAADEMRQMQTPVLAVVPGGLSEVYPADVTGENGASALLPLSSRNRLVRVENRMACPDEKSCKAESADAQTVANDLEKVLREKETCLPAVENELEDVSRKGKKENRKSRRPSTKDKLHLPDGSTGPSHNGWSLGLSVGNAAGATGEGGGYPVMSRVSMQAVANGFMDIPNDKTVVFEGDIPYLLQKNRVLDIKHHQPISVGVSFRKALPKGFSIETGLMYTLLSSDLKVENHNRELEQKLHYIGIPLRANWNFLDKKLFTLYVSGGGMMEKCVYGKVGTEKETVKPLQFSVSGGIGGQLNVTKHVGIYVEPGVAYFFDDGSDVQTIRKENPFQFHVQAGIRFTY
ncbi:hypothetical protein EVA_04712 [gut metagenome]|uniref:Uncharacterized protein n=1 Tax=gut metagenome TaxID=749906 RepID=J9GW37_9ZZZZ